MKTPQTVMPTATDLALLSRAAERTREYDETKILRRAADILEREAPGRADCRAYLKAAALLREIADG